MEPYKFTGEVHFIGATQIFNSGFAKRILVCKAPSDGGQYPNYAMFEFCKGSTDGARDRTRELDEIAKGDQVEISFYVYANENRNRPGQWFTSLRPVKLEVKQRAAASNIPAPPPAIPTAQDAATDDDNVPF